MKLSSNAVEYAAVPQVISEINGIVVRQRFDVGEVVAQAWGLPWEKQNRYRISKLPVNKVVKNEPNDSDGWEPSEEELEQLDSFLFAKEESSCFTRCCLTYIGCKNLRPLKLHISVADNTGDIYVINRPFRCGGSCCHPLTMSLDMVTDNQTHRLGRVRENYSPYFSKCCASCCLATRYTDIEVENNDGTYERKYTLRTNLSCCGRVNNCCGGTCFRNDAVYDILDTNQEVVAHLQKTFASGRSCCNACCRMGFGYTNYILEFPPHSTSNERMLILTALFQVEYYIFESDQN